jgi:PAS domain S-box-containing protein
VFQRFLPRIEHANYAGPGIAPGTQTGAFRVSSSRPLVVIVERPLNAVITDWVDEVRLQMIVVLITVLTVVGLTVTASRSLKAREEGRQRLDNLAIKIARSEHELNVIVRSIQEFLFRIDAEGVLTFVNAHWMAATGESPATILGTRLEDLVAPEEQMIVKAMLEPGAASGARTATLTFWAATTHPRRVDIALVPLHDGRQATGFAGSAVDITAREEAEAQLAEQLAFMALLQDMSPLPMSMRDMSGRYVDVNRAWLEFVGSSRGDVLGRSGDHFVQDAEARVHEAQDQRLQVSGGQIQYEASLTRSDGDRRDLLITKVLVPGRDGRPQGILSTFMDVTELRNASRAMQEAREVAEEASRTKSEFIANISHELRTPLQSIIGFSELGAGRVRNDALVAGMFTDILASGQRMLALVNDLLDVSKIESAVGTIHLERTDLRPLLRNVVREIAPLVGAKHLTIDMRLPPTALSAKVDPFRFQQVVRNVLANAIRFSPPGESIELGARRASDGSLHIWVRDHGPGIPPDEFEDIFDAFVQSSKTKDGSGGTGLGLAICRKILDAHRGTIGASNAPGGGARFDVLLPPNEFSETTPGVLEELI